MYFSIWVLHFMVMEPLSFMCPVFVHRPGQAVANSYTVHNSHFVFVHLCFFGGRASRWLGRHFVCKEFLSSLFGRCFLGFSPQHHTLCRCLALKGHMCNPFIKNSGERWTRPTLRMTHTTRCTVREFTHALGRLLGNEQFQKYLLTPFRYNQILDPLSDLYLWNFLYSRLFLYRLRSLDVQ